MTITDHDGTETCPACAKVESVFAMVGEAIGGMSSRDAAFLCALLIHRVHTAAPDEDCASTFLMEVSIFLKAMCDSDEDENSEVPNACH